MYIDVIFVFQHGIMLLVPLFCPRVVFILHEEASSGYKSECFHGLYSIEEFLMFIHIVINKHAYSRSMHAFQQFENEILLKVFIKNQSSWNEQLGSASVFAYILMACFIY